MLKVICTEVIKGNNNEILGYTIQDTTGKKMTVKAEALQQAIASGQIACDNINIKTGENTGSVVNNGDVKQTDKSQAEAGKKERMVALVEQLNKARAVYEQGTDEIMSNFEYDKLYDELLKLESELGYTLASSPTQNVGYEVVSKLEKCKHETPMLSLDKTKDREALVSWLNGKEGVLSWKMDGLTVVLEYNGGKLVKAVTRGNGEIGEIVTANAKQFINVPRTIAFNGKLVLRGEAVISYADFERINESAEEKFKNPRNLCSGSVRQLDSKITKSRCVKWYAFELVEADGLDIGVQVSKQLNKLKTLGFDVVEHKIVTPSNLLSTIAYFESKVNNYEIPTDGLVLTFEDKEYGKSLGMTSKFPRHSIAFKWTDEEVETKLVNIEWQVGRTGVITPVAEFDSVDIEGSTVSRASLHNLSIMVDTLGQPYVGQKLKVYKANMIIPCVAWGEKLEDLTNTSVALKKLYAPAECPCCGEPTEMREDPKSGVYTLWCNNPDCRAKGDKSFEHFVKRDCMNVEGVSGSTLQTLVDYGIITDFASLYEIKNHKSEICGIEGFGEVSFNNLVKAVEKSRDVKLANLIFALGIPNVGLATAKLICRHFNNDLADTVSASYEQLTSIEGVGGVIAESFVNYFADKENADNFVKLTKELRIVAETVSNNTAMKGVTICVTGDVYQFSSRRVIKDVVEQLGGKLTSAVSKSTSYLVTNDTTSGSNKNKAAQQYGIPILSEEEFINKFNLQGYVR